MNSLGNEHLELIEAPLGMWESASLNFANTASGNVNAVIYNPAYNGVSSIFWRIEMPSLAANPAVNEVVIRIFE